MNIINQLQKERDGVSVLVELTSAFEGIASLKVAQTKQRVETSTKFFNELWSIYRLLRVEEEFNYGRIVGNEHHLIAKELYIIITAEGGFSGDIDLKLVNYMIEGYDPKKHDVVVIGYHGAIQLAQKGIDYLRYFKLPVIDQNINTVPILEIIQKYLKTTVFYQSYITLMHQEVKKMDLSEAVKINIDRESEDTISKHNYIFEPNTHEVAAHLEKSMIEIAISQLILNSKLAQFASRFKAMSTSNHLALDQKETLTLSLNRAQRNQKDQRLREISNAFRLAQKGAY